MNEIKVLDKGFVVLVDHMGDDNRVVQSARVSYGEGTKSYREDRGLIRYLMRMDHSGPFEKVVFEFHMKLPVFVARQMVRYRVSRINELSLRYSVAPEDYYIPDVEHIQKQSTDNKQGRGDEFDEHTANHIISNMKSMARDEFKHYNWMLDQGVAREIARINLPVSTYTEWYYQMDLRNLFHFLKQRLDRHAQYEIRVYAEAMYELIKPIVPISCEAFEDYILNARTFSAQEMEYLRSLITEEFLEKKFPELSKGEKEEFKMKLSNRIDI